MKKILVLAMLTQFTAACGCEVVDTGNRGIKVEYGKVVGEALPEDLYFYNPLTSNIIEMSVREEKLEDITDCFTRDTQNVKVAYALTYAPDPKKIHLLYQNFGRNWEEKIIKPILLQSIKDVVGRYVADDLVFKREEARAAAFSELQKALAARDVNATTLSITNLDFDDQYEKAVEAKVVAIQRAAEAKNKTVEVEETARQQVISAKAQAESMQIRSEALAKNKGLVEYEAVQRWDGKLPQYMLSNTMPFLPLQPKGN